MQVVNSLVLKLWLAQKIFGGYPAANAVCANHNQRMVGEKFSFTGAYIGQGYVNPPHVKLVKFPLIAHIDHGGIGLLAKVALHRVVQYRYKSF